MFPSLRIHIIYADVCWLLVCSVLTKDQAKEKFDELIGAATSGPRLWMDASEVPGLLGGGSKGAAKSESLQIKHIFPRGKRLLYRNPEVASSPGRKPNPRGLPPRLSIERLWDVLGTDLVKRIRSYDWDAYEALEAEIASERKAFLSCLRKTVGKSCTDALQATSIPTFLGNSLRRWPLICA